MEKESMSKDQLMHAQMYMQKKVQKTYEGQNKTDGFIP